MLTHACLGDNVTCQGYRTDFEISSDTIVNYLVRKRNNNFLVLKKFIDIFDFGSNSIQLSFKKVFDIYFIFSLHSLSACTMYFIKKTRTKLIINKTDCYLALPQTHLVTHSLNGSMDFTLITLRIV